MIFRVAKSGFVLPWSTICDGINVCQIKEGTMLACFIAGNFLLACSITCAYFTWMIVPLLEACEYLTVLLAPYLHRMTSLPGRARVLLFVSALPF